MPLAHLPPQLQPAFLALERSSSILFKRMPLAHPPPNLQNALLPLEITSTILSTSMQLVHPPPNRQTVFLARTNLNYPIHTHATRSSSNIIHLLTCNLLFQPWNKPQRLYLHPCHLLVYLLSCNLFLALDPTSTILPT